MTKRTELEHVLHLACLTEDRTSEEQRALLAVALRLDSEYASFESSNPDPRPPALTNLVLNTRTRDPEVDRRDVKLTGDQRRKLDSLYEKWRPCRVCAVPVGAHPAVGCPRMSAHFDLDRLKVLAAPYAPAPVQQEMTG